MKSILNRSRIVLGTLLVAAVQSVSNAQSVPPSPVLATNAGWDCLISAKGSQQGILFMTFNNDGTIEGAMVVAKVAKPKVDTGRSGIPSDRDPADPTPPAITNLYGFTHISGLWNFDAKGYTIGVFTHNVVVGDSTNVNQVSFKAKIAANKRLTASFSSTVMGNGTYRGVPIKTVTDLTGGWSAKEKDGSLISYEWFSLENAPEIWPNIYEVDGYGPGYDVGGYCMVSSQKKIAFGTREFLTPSNAITRGTVGSFINKSSLLGGKTKGLSDSGTNVISYDAFRVSAPIPD